MGGVELLRRRVVVDLARGGMISVGGGTKRSASGECAVGETRIAIEARPN